jgi:general stress protein 26
MVRADGEGERCEVARLLAGAAQVVTSVRYCWLILPSDGGVPSARPMGRLVGELGEAGWVIRFLVDTRSRKVGALKHTGVLTVTFEKQADDAFVFLAGKAALLTEIGEVRKHWRNSLDAYFPTGEDRAHAGFIELSVSHMEIWIRGVTPEPFGVKPTILELDANGSWRLAR